MTESRRAVGFAASSRLLRGAFATMFGQIINVAANFLLVPLYLSRWSAGVYGDWMALSALATYLGITDLGMNSAVGNRLISANTIGSRRTYQSVQATALVFYISIAIVATLLVGGGCVFLSVAALLGISFIPPATANMVVWLLAVRVVWSMPLGQIISFYRTIGQFSITQWLNNLQALTVAGVAAAVLLLNGGPVGVAQWSLLPMALIVLGVLIDVKIRHSDLFPNFLYVQWSCFLELVRPSLQFAGIMMSFALVLQVPVIVMSRLLGGQVVATFVTTRTVTNVVRQLIGVIQAAVWPELTRAHATKNKSAAARAHRVLLGMSMSIAGASVGGLWWDGSFIVASWTRGKIIPSENLVRMMALAAFVQAMWSSSALLGMSGNRVDIVSRQQILATVCGVTIGGVGMKWAGPIAVPFGLMLGELLFCIFLIPRAICRDLGVPVQMYLFRLAITFALVLASAVCVSRILGLMLSEQSWVRFAISSTLAGSVAVVVAWKGCLMKGDREDLKSIIHHHICRVYRMIKME